MIGDADLVRLAVETVHEGCVGETLASLEASIAVRQAGSEHVRRTLALIADDEARHAELAWAFVRWAMRKGGEPVRRAVRRAFREATESSAAAEPAKSQDRSAGPGRLSDRARIEVHRKGVAEVIAPAARVLLAA